MYLKALEIQGFKSFPDKTRLSFEKDVTAIVGPNGSGKSNISDAILWVMGEQRSKALRGTKMEDVIFGGTEKRGRLGYAQVTLILDNSSRIIDSENEEIMLTRRYYRSGESEYSINRETVRLKDIHSLLMDTGLGRDGYSIIGQGRIAEIVSSRSTDRREVFEEAAGISRYRYRKEEAERKLEKTEENLLRIHDKIEELELQVGPLRQQAETAKKYLLLRDELRVREISVWMLTLEKLHAQSEDRENEFRQASDALDRARQELEALYASSESISERMRRKDVETDQIRDRLSAAEAAVNESESAAAVLRAGVKNGEENLQRMLLDVAEQDTRVRELREQIEQNTAKIDELSARLRDVMKELSSNANILDGCRMKLKNREEQLRQLTDRAASLNADGRAMDERIRLLTAMEKEYEGYSRAVKTVMQEVRRGTLKGIHGPVAELLRTDDETSLAIETALGGTGQHIVVDTMNDGRSAIDLLKKRDAGRATFLPLEAAKGGVLKDLPVNDPGYVGLAYDLVRFDERYEPVMKRLLGWTVVAETLGDAIRISRASGHKLRIVSLDGQLISGDGSMTGGSAARGTGILSRANELEKLRKERVRLQEKEKTVQAELDKARSQMETLRYQLDRALEDQSALQSSRSSLEAEQRATENGVRQLQVLLESLSGDHDSRRQAIRAAEDRIEAQRQQIREREEQATQRRQAAQAVRDEIAAVSKSRLELEARRTRAEKDAQQRSAQIIDLERSVARLEQRKISAEMEEKQILDKLWDNYELSHSAAMALRQPVENLGRTNREIADLRRQISALGTPNIGAIEEFERVNTRYEFLSTQRDDVEKAKRELLGVIRDVTAEMKDVFVEKFREIDVCFRQTFLELFGGGKAALVLEDEENVLECGIDIRVQPPGKALSTISLLSGGEMAFVAIALYFAIIKVRPTPFCVMDEIEAALDESNVNRFAAYLRRMSDKTQFLVITHRRGTMEEADVLYGVTMQEKGVSTVIELDLESAKKTMEE